MNTTLAELLSGGDRRSIGKAAEVAEYVVVNPHQIDGLAALLEHHDEVVRMRAADALEKVLKKHTTLIADHLENLLKIGRSTSQQEIQWHTAQIIGHAAIPEHLAKQCFVFLSEVFADTHSKIAQTSALDAMARLADQFPEYRGQVKKKLSHALQTGTPSVCARARKLSKNFSWL